MVEDPTQKILRELLDKLAEEQGSAEPTVTFALFAWLVEAFAHLQRQNDRDTVDVRLEYLRREIAKIKRHLDLPGD